MISSNLGWIYVSIEDINFFKSKNIIPSNFTEQPFELYSVPEFQNNKPEIVLGKEIGSTKQQVELNDILLCKINPRINRVWKVFETLKYPQIASSEWIVIRQPLINTNYLRFYFCSSAFRNLLCSDVSGVGGSLTRAQPKKVATYKIPLASFAEQQQIAAKLDELLAQVDAIKTRLDAIPKILKRFRQAVLAAAVSGRLTADWRKTEELVNWQESVLANLVKKPSYGTSAKSQPEGKVPVLRMGNLQNGKLDWSDLVYTSDEDEICKYRLCSGDVLFNRTNSPELVGKTSIYRGEREAIYAGYLIRIQCTEKLNPEFLNMLLNAPSARAYCRAVKSDGVSQSNINAQKLIAYPIHCPPIDEQTEIVCRVEQFFTYAEQIEQRVKDAQTRVNKLTQAILAKAFRGELTADWRAQHPELISGENSAEALLARIKAERESCDSGKKSKKAF